MFILVDNFGDRLKEERLRLGLTQEGLANKTGVQSITIIQYEKEKSSPSVKFLNKLQEAGMDINYLLTSTRTYCQHQKISPNMIKKIADSIDKIESEVFGQLLDSEARVKLTCIMLHQYASEDIS